jgi:hypothetical protein
MTVGAPFPLPRAIILAVINIRSLMNDWLFAIIVMMPVSATGTREL